MCGNLTADSMERLFLPVPFGKPVFLLFMQTAKNLPVGCVPMPNMQPCAHMRDAH
jgi:hypothetical protein